MQVVVFWFVKPSLHAPGRKPWLTVYRPRSGLVYFFLYFRISLVLVSISARLTLASFWTPALCFWQPGSKRGILFMDWAWRTLAEFEGGNFGAFFIFDIPQLFWPYSCRDGLEHTIRLQQYPSPTGGKATRLMHKIIRAIATLQSIITFDPAIGSKYSLVRTFIYIRACRMHNGTSRNMVWRKI